MGQQTYDLLSESNGRLASINGATQIRAGVIRPEIIIPINDASKNSNENKAEKTTGMIVVALLE